MECIVCAYEIDCVERFPAIGACGHNGLCSLCSLKIRALQRNMGCISCKRELEHVICSAKPDAKYEDFPMWGDSIGPEYVLDQKSQMFFPTDYYKNKIQKLWVYKCTVCSHTFRDVKALKSHVNSEHNMHICMHCVENKNDFPAEHRIYTQKQYDTHLREGDQDGSLGHPNCEFCKKRFYDSTALFVHLNKEHYTCHLCDKVGVKFKYFKDYKHLENHFRSGHLLCEDPACLARKFVVFDNEIDMEVHNRKYHPTFTFKRPTTIKLDFKVARPTATRGGSEEAGQKGAADGAEDEAGATHHDRDRRVRYEGGLGGRERNGEWQVELQPLSSTDPRDPNRHADGASGAAESLPPPPRSEAFVEEFPTLQSTAGPTAGGAGGPIVITNKWVSLGNAPNRKTGKKNDFPALQAKKPAAKAPTNNTLSALQKDYASLSSESPMSSLTSNNNTPRPQTGSLGDWARIKVVDKKASAGSKASGGGSAAAAGTDKGTGKGTGKGRGGAADYAKTMYENVLGAEYEDSLAIALAESLSDAYRASAPSSGSSGSSGVVLKPLAAEQSSIKSAPPPPPPSAASATSATGDGAFEMVAPPRVPAALAYARSDVSNQEAYPALAASAPTSSAPPRSQAGKKKQSARPTGAGGWSEALSAVGMAGAAGTNRAPAKSKLTVIKASTSNSSLNKAGEEEPVSGVKAGAAAPPGLQWENLNLKPIGKKASDEGEWRAGPSGAHSRGSSGISAGRVSTSASSGGSNGSEERFGNWVKIGGAGKEHGGAADSGAAAAAAPYRSLQDFPTLGAAGSPQFRAK